jgi:hypothetical protein
MIGLVDHLHELCASGAHRFLVEPTFGRLGVDENDLGWIGFGQPPRNRFGNHARGEILVLGVDQRSRQRAVHRHGRVVPRATGPGFWREVIAQAPAQFLGRDAPW